MVTSGRHVLVLGRGEPSTNILSFTLLKVSEATPIIGIGTGAFFVVVDGKVYRPDPERDPVFGNEKSGSDAHQIE